MSNAADWNCAVCGRHTRAHMDLRLIHRWTVPAFKAPARRPRTTRGRDRRAYQRWWYEQNKGAVIAYQRWYRAVNRERKRANDVAYYERNRERIIKHNTAYGRLHADRRRSLSKAARRRAGPVKVYHCGVCAKPGHDRRTCPRALAVAAPPRVLSELARRLHR